MAQWAMVAVQVVGTVAQMVGSSKEASAQEDQADAIQRETQLERHATAKRNQQIISRNRNVAAAANVDPFSGTAEEVEFSNAFDAGMNEAMITYAGNVRKQRAKMGAAQSGGEMFGSLTSFAGSKSGGFLADKGQSIMGSWFNQSKTFEPGTYWGNSKGLWGE